MGNFHYRQTANQAKKSHMISTCSNDHHVIFMSASMKNRHGPLKHHDAGVAVDKSCSKTDRRLRLPDSGSSGLGPPWQPERCCGWELWRRHCWRPKRRRSAGAECASVMAAPSLPHQRCPRWFVCASWTLCLACCSASPLWKTHKWQHNLHYRFVLFFICLFLINFKCFWWCSAVPFTCCF